MRDFVDKIVKAKLGMNFPLVMHGAALLYEVGDDLEKDMVANYAANLEKVYFMLCVGIRYYIVGALALSKDTLSIFSPSGAI